jgi:acetyl-CoA carboxylase biotin carboxyl carrier protein
VDLKQIKELMALMEKAGITKVRIKDKDKYEIELERQEEGVSHSPAVTLVHAPHPDIHSKFPSHAHPPYRGHLEEAPKMEEPKKGADGKFIAAPLVGTVYHSPSPEDPPFVKVGDRVDENTVVCIIEAMKVMNEVKAGMSGTIAEILVSNAHPVEFGAKIIRIV